MSKPEQTNRAVFAAFCLERGFDPSDFHENVISRKKDRKRHHAVTRFHRDGSLGFGVKSTHRPSDPETFLARIKTHQEAQAVDIAVPYLHNVDLTNRAIVYDWIDGETLSDVWHNHRRLPALEAAGQWLSQFHRKSGVTQRAFQARFMAEHFARLRDEAASGTRKIPKLKQFCHHLDHLTAFGQQADGKPVRSSLSHGDFNARNVLITPTGDAVGIDFGQYRTAPVTYDVARLMVHLGSISKAPIWDETSTIAGPILDGFLSKYEGLTALDPVLQYLLRVRILIDWAASHDSPMSLSKWRRLRRLYQGADVVFSKVSTQSTTH